MGSPRKLLYRGWFTALFASLLWAIYVQHKAFSSPVYRLPAPDRSYPTQVQEVVIYLSWIDHFAYYRASLAVIGVGVVGYLITYLLRRNSN